MTALKLTKIGNSIGMVLPKEVLQTLKVDLGDQLYLTALPDGGYRLTPYSDEFEQQMKVAREITKDWRNALRELAK